MDGQIGKGARSGDTKGAPREGRQSYGPGLLPVSLTINRKRYIMGLTKEELEERAAKKAAEKVEAEAVETEVPVEETEGE